MDVRKRFAMNGPLEQEGVEVHIDGDAYVTLARAGGSNVRYENTLRRLTAPHRRALDSGSLDNTLAIDLLQQAYADAVVIGWRGVEYDGEPLAFSRDNALKVLRELPELWKIVQEEANRIANYRQEEISEMGKASLPH